MADANYYSKYEQHNQVHNYNNPSKFYSHFLYKALIVTIFLVILLLFPSQAPEFINQTLNTRGWEFLHLIFVGIAVSYGLFSRRNDETEKDSINSSSNNHSKFDNSHSYVSRFLEVSSVFDDEGHIPSRSDGSTVQTWNNQYYRNEPAVVVADEYSVLHQEPRGASSRIGEKPLLLPVRSLKSRLLDADANGTDKEFLGGSASISRSNSNLGSKRISSNSVKSRNGELSGLHNKNLEDNLKDNVVLPSPIPWRSRSGRMEMKEPKEETDTPLYALPPSSMEESEFNRSFRAQVSRAPTTSSPKLSPSSSMSSPKKFSTPPSFLAETQGKLAEDFVRKKSVFRSPPPPPPPPPPQLQLIRKSWTMKPSSGAIDDEVFFENDLKRSFTSEPEDMNWVGSLSMAKSVRTTRKEKEFDDVMNKKTETRSKEVEASTMDKRGRKTVRFDQSPSFKTENINRERVTFKSQPTYMEFPKEEKEEFVEKIVFESDEDLETEEEEDEEEISTSGFVSGNLNKEEGSSSTASDGGPDVDKKADEFIAKFREQIRLQRIESIKRSSGQITRKSTR